MLIRYDIIVGFIVAFIITMVIHKTIHSIVLTHVDKKAELSKTLNKLFKTAYVVIISTAIISMLLFGYYYPPDKVGKVGVVEQVGTIEYRTGENNTQSKSAEIKEQSLEDQKESLERFQDFKNQTIKENQ